ncbi:uncharacterized protein TNCV_2051851 [Trichonephila clavipes]|nr:uncharacterized protein TNCV_2051851 [Trichonephila clavipes]
MYKRALSSKYRTNHNLTKFRKISRREETVTPTTSGYNFRPRFGKGEESRPTIERKTQQGGPSRYRKGRESNDSPYIEERTRSSNKNARRGGDQQRQDQERRGTWTKKSLSLEVLVRHANYKSSEPVWCQKWDFMPKTRAMDEQLKTLLEGINALKSGPEETKERIEKGKEEMQKSLEDMQKSQEETKNELIDRMEKGLDDIQKGQQEMQTGLENLQKKSRITEGFSGEEYQ